MTTKTSNPVSYLFTYSPMGNTCNPTFTFMEHISDYFWSWHKCMEAFEVNPEFNSNGNLHYHGYYVLKDKYRWYKSVLPKLKYNGMWRSEQVKDSLEKAMVYCRKDRELMVKCIDHKIPFTQEDKIQPKVEVKTKNILNYII